MVSWAGWEVIKDQPMKCMLFQVYLTVGLVDLNNTLEVLSSLPVGLICINYVSSFYKLDALTFPAHIC